MSLFIVESVGMELQELEGLSCRIRTKFRDSNGKGIYLEVSGSTKGKYSTTSVKNLPFEKYGVINHLLELTEHDEEDIRLDHQYRHTFFEYTKEGILNFVNKNFGTTFTDIKFDSHFNIHDCPYPIC